MHVYIIYIYIWIHRSVDNTTLHCTAFGWAVKERSGTCRARRDASSSSGPVMQHDTYVTIDTIMMCMQ